MALFGLAEGSKAIGERLGRDAHYSAFALPHVRSESRSRPFGRLLWLVSLLLLVAVVVLALLVALGL
jgi:hypothetical protein